MFRLAPSGTSRLTLQIADEPYDRCGNGLALTMRKLLSVSSVDTRDVEFYLSESNIPVRLKSLEKCDRYGITGYVAKFHGVMLQWSTIVGSYEIIPANETEYFVFTFLKSGSFRYHFRRTIIDLQPNFAIACKSPGKIEAQHNSTHSSVIISKNTIMKRLSVLLDGAPPANISFSVDPVSRQSVETLFDFVDDLETSPIMAMAGLMRHRTESVADVVVDAVLLSYPNNCLEVLSKTVPTVAPKHVKRAVDYIHSHPKSHHSPEFLASLSSVSVRALQYSFKGFIGHTISEYQYLNRLRCAQQDMIDNPDVSLTVISQKWGFGSLSSFGQGFKKVYGQTPSSFIRERRTSYGR
jgi:AraC-like DNA-binding protein